MLYIDLITDSFSYIDDNGEFAQCPHKHTQTAQRACRVKISSKQRTQAKDQPESNFKTVCLHLLHLPILKDFFKDDDLAHTTYTLALTMCVGRSGVQVASRSKTNDTCRIRHRRLLPPTPSLLPHVMELKRP